MKQTQKYQLAVQLLKEINCPKGILDQLAVWSIFIHNDEVKLNNWIALSQEGVIEGEGREITET